MKNIINIIRSIWASSIRRQLILGIVLVHAVLMSIFVYDLVERQRQFLYTQNIEQAKSLANTLAVNSVASVLANDVVGLEEIMSAQVNYPSLQYAMVLNPKVRVLGHTDKYKVGLYVNDSISGKLLSAKKEQIVLVNNFHTIDMASPIFSNNRFVGWARISLSQKDNTKNLQVITRNGLLYTLLAIVIGTLFAYFMARSITKSLKNIVDVTDGFTKGSSNLRANVSRSDEVGRLAKAFNLMLDTINKNKRDFQAVMDNSSAVIYGKDLEGRYIFTNKLWLKLFDKKNVNVIGKTDHEFFEKGFADKFRKNDLAVLKAGRALSSEEVAPHQDGPHTYITVKFPLLDERGDIYGICGISTDITDRINIEKENTSLENQLFHSQKMQAIGQLTGGIAHDFNNLLVVILGYTELSIEKFAKDNARLSDYLNHINMAGIRGRDLIQQMMVYSRKDQREDELTSIKIEDVIDETMTLLKATFPVGITIESSIQINMPSVKTNASLITQVLMNLCINAKDSIRNEGHILISLAVENFDDQVCNSCYSPVSGEYVVLSVEDDGEGIADDILGRIFEPFFTMKSIGEGTGMGLSVVHGVVHKLGGHIFVNSVIGEGASFKVLLPISTNKIEQIKPEMTKDINYDFSGMNIMVVDDESAVADFIAESLKHCNARVEVFTRSDRALAHFAAHAQDFDLVVTDQAMPVLTGLELSEKLMAIRSDIKIILLTGHADDVSVPATQKMGIKAFIYKPVKINDFYHIINNLD